VALDDYAGLLQAGQNLVPDVTAELAKTAYMHAQAQEAQAQAAEATQKINRAQQFQQDIHTYDGSPTAASHLMMKYPEFADHLKQGWDVQDKAKQQADLRTMGEIYSAASGGNWALAKKLAHERADAEKASGYSDPAYDETMRVMDTAADGDPTQQKVVLNMLGTSIAAVAGPEHFASVYGGLRGDDKGYTLEAGATRYDSAGHVVAQSPYIKTADGGILEANQPGGGGQTSPGAAPTTAPGGFANAVAHVLSNEGGYNPRDMNGAPVKYGINAKANAAELKAMGVSDIRDLTKEQAAQLYHDKYWAQSGAENLPPNLQAPYFDVYVRNPAFAKRALAQSNLDPAKFMATSSAYFQKLAQKPSGQPYAKAWATRDAANTAIATGGASGDMPTAPVQGEAPPGYHWLTPPKQKDAPSGFRWGADGKTLEAIPGGPADESGLDPATTEFYAQSYLSTGQMPPLGMGKSATKIRQQIMKQAATIAGADGLSGKDLALQMAHYKAGVANISNLEKQLGTVQGNELTFSQNAQQVAQLARKLPSQTGSRILNTPIQTFLRQTNDPTVAALDVAIKTAANEYARLVTASPSGAGTLSDSARLEYQGIIEGNFPLQQKISALRQMQIDASNRTSSLKTTLQDSYAHLTDRAPELRSGGSAALPKGAKVVGTYHGKRVIEVNGKRMVEQ
jgi:hypothetical protein